MVELSHHKQTGEGSFVDLSFQTSYTLDLLCFIDLLISDFSSEFDSDVTYFRNFLSYEGEVNMNYLKKTFGRELSLQQLIAPLLVADKEFAKLTPSELLVSGRYLINAYRQSAAYKKASIWYQRFLQQEAIQIIAALEPIVADLERGGFKHYWLLNHLPAMNKTIEDFGQRFDWDRLSSILGDWTKGKLHVHVCGLAQLDFNNLGSGHFLATADTAGRRLGRSLVEEAVSSAIAPINFSLMLGALPRTEDILQLKFSDRYLQKSASLALEYYLKEQLSFIQNAERHLLNVEKGQYELAVLMYGYMQATPKTEETLGDYFEKFLRSLDITKLSSAKDLKIA